MPDKCWCEIYCGLADLAERLEACKHKAAQCSQLSHTETHTLGWHERLINWYCYCSFVLPHVSHKNIDLKILWLWLSQTIWILCYLDNMRWKAYLHTIEFALSITHYIMSMTTELFTLWCVECGVWLFALRSSLVSTALSPGRAWVWWLSSVCRSLW